MHDDLQKEYTKLKEEYEKKCAGLKEEYEKKLEEDLSTPEGSRKPSVSCHLPVGP